MAILAAKRARFVWPRTVRAPLSLLCAALAAIPLSGCLGGAPASGEEVKGSAAPLDGETVVEGVVVDTEFVPLPEVDVLLAQHEVRAVTGEDGRFQILPPGPGDYTLVFNKDGYASQELGISVYESEPARVLVTLVPVASHVPYHETRIVFTYTQCWFSAGPAGAACLGLVDYLAGTSVSQDRLTHVFSVQENLGNLLIEIMYKAQSLGKEAIIVVREPGSLYSGAQKSWLLQFGPSPIRAWLVPDQVGTGGRDKFMADPTIKYMALIGGWGSNSTIPSVALHLDFRTQTHFNLFYNRPGPPDFTSLPDQ